MKRKNYLLFFYLPFLSLILIFSFLSYLNRRYITRQVEAVVYEQLKATAGILKKDISHLLQEGFPLEEVFKFYSGEENIYFIAVLDARKNVVGWSSRFEGYLPLSARYLEPEKGWVIESPLGKIYNYFTAFPTDKAGGANETAAIDKTVSPGVAVTTNEATAVNKAESFSEDFSASKAGTANNSALPLKVAPTRKADKTEKASTHDIASPLNKDVTSLKTATTRETAVPNKAGTIDRPQSTNKTGTVGEDITPDKMTTDKKTDPAEKVAASQVAGASHKATPPAKSASPEIAGQIKYLYLGYSLENLEMLLAQAQKNFWIILGVFFVFGLLMSVGFFILQRRFWAKEQEILHTRAEMERYREISAFTSGVAHEIKNPLNSLSLVFEILRKKGPAELQDKVALGQAEVKRISRVIDEFSRLLKPFRLQRERLELREFINRVVNDYKTLAADQRVAVKVKVPDGLYFQADPLLFAQAVGNVLKNALEASPTGEVVIKGEKQADKIMLTITDSGPGLTAEEAGRIFEPFFTTKKEGLGIGLYLARKIVEAHGGRITARARWEGGTMFKIELGG